MYMEVPRKHMPWVIAFVLAMILTAGWSTLFSAPADFSSGTLVGIEEGMSTPEIANVLAQNRIIRHPFILRALLRVSGESNNVQKGTYKFEKPQNIFVIAYRLVAANYGLPPVRLTFVEGATVREMALQVTTALPLIRAEEFLAGAKADEGYLFPDTYFFQPGATSKSIIDTLRANFDKKIATISTDVVASGHSLSDIVTMASLVEKEARTSADRRMIAGILWNRIDRGMPLQVDAVFGYIFNTATYSPSPKDLQVSSPYNTYTHIGLPPGPIDNPGLDALLSAANPTKTNNLFYLTGHDGLMHYATTYAGHQANLKKYLR